VAWTGTIARCTAAVLWVPWLGEAVVGGHDTSAHFHQRQRSGRVLAASSKCLESMQSANTEKFAKEDKVTRL